MKIEIGAPHVVLQGPSYEDSYWGQFQFPAIFKTTDGNLAIRIHGDQDLWESYGIAGSDMWCISKDNGITWSPCSSEIEPCVVGTVLPNEDQIHFPLQPAIIVPEDQVKLKTFLTRLPSDTIHAESENSWPFPVYHFRDAGGKLTCIYDFDTIPVEYRKKEWQINRVYAGETNAVQESVPLDFPNMSVCGVIYSGTMKILKPAPLCQVKVDPCGNVWACSYTHAHMNPISRGPDPHSAVLLFKSTDNAHSFKLQSYIPFQPNTTRYPTSYCGGGFLEADFEFMDDGSIIVLMRTTSIEVSEWDWNTLYFTRSTDGGLTFSDPEPFSDRGVLPHLCKLECGITLAAYGRPGIAVRCCTDSTGVLWGKEIEILPRSDRSFLMNTPPERPTFWEWVGSCCNVDLKPISSNQALLVYSDFFYPDPSGKKCKTILSRIITVVL